MSHGISPRAGLFRNEAIEAASRRFLSNTTLVTPLGFAVHAAFASAVAASIVLFLIFGRYSPKDTVRGYLTTTEGNVKIYPQTDGVVLRVLVKDGERVLSGQKLLDLGTARGIGQSAASRRAVVVALRSERDALRTQTRSEKAAFLAQEKSVRSEIASLAKRLTLLKAREETLRSAAKIARRQVARLTALQSGRYVSGQDRDAAASTLAEYEVRLAELALRADDVRAAIRRNESALAGIPPARERRLAELESERHRLSVRVAEGIERDTQSVVAPDAGVVTGLLVRKGQTVSAGSVLMSLIPEHSRYYAELLIPTRTIGFVRRGASVRIRYDAFPYQKFGTDDGVVERIARSTVLAADKAFPIAVNGPVYMAQVALSDQGMVANRETRQLQAGMTLTADILRDERRIIEWLIDPLTGAAQRL